VPATSAGAFAASESRPEPGVGTEGRHRTVDNEHVPPIKPPDAVLVIGEIAQRSGIGAYCWVKTGGPVAGAAYCGDDEEVTTSAAPLTAFSPLTASLRLPLQPAPTEVQLQVLRVTDQDRLNTTPGGIRWRSHLATPVTLEATITQEIDLKLDPGLYVWRVSARWDRVGNVVYGFLINVHST
jgi:hypothetical protein